MEEQIGGITVGYEPFRDGWRIYVRGGDGTLVGFIELEKDERLCGSGLGAWRR